MATRYEHGPEASFGLVVEPGDLISTVTGPAVVVSVTDEEITVTYAEGKTRNIRTAAVGTLKLLSRPARLEAQP